MKALYALVFVLFSFAAPAQTLEASIAAYYLDDLDCLGETTKQSTMPAQIIATEPTGVAITGPSDAEDFPVDAIQPSDENSTVKYSTGSDDRLTEDDTIEQSAIPAQIIATEPTIEKPCEAMRNEADDVVITGPNDAEDVPVGAIQPCDLTDVGSFDLGQTGASSK